MDEKQYLSVDGNSASGDVEGLVRERVHGLYYDREIRPMRRRLGCTAQAVSGRSAAWWRER